ncbi:MAG: tRNA-specific adenosine deaminase [Gammaproteobacteria bacterium]|nr:tRNA-specific adenosine deaminase [Gammaproteobacteria bacterium]
MSSDYKIQQEFMRHALMLAHDAQEVGEIPVGALVVRSGEILGKGSNRVITDLDPSAHAEVVAIRDAASRSGNFRLTGSVLYVTLEPCVMCAGAILQARIEKVVFAAWDERFGAAGSQLNLLESPFLNHQCQVHSGVLQEEAGMLLKNFFSSRR